MRAVAVLLALVCATSIVRADDKPWAEGVSAEDQANALELYRQGNEMFEQARYLEALKLYQDALDKWKHPSIHYNAAVCLINLGRPDEAYENLMAAMRFGGEPLSAELQRQAKTYETLLTGQLAELEVQCKEPQAKVLLDGKELLDCPGTQARKVRVGRHQVVGEKPGFEKETRAIELRAGKKTTLVLEFKVVGSKGHLERRWNKKLPWSVLGAGVAVGIVAIPLGLHAQTTYDDYAATLTGFEKCHEGCNPAVLDAAERMKLDDADARRNRAALYAYTAMGVAAVGIGVGFTMVLLNQPRLVGGAAVKPEVGTDHASLSLVGRW